MRCGYCGDQCQKNEGWHQALNRSDSILIGQNSTVLPFEAGIVQLVGNRLDCSSRNAAQTFSLCQSKGNRYAASSPKETDRRAVASRSKPTWRPASLIRSADENAGAASRYRRRKAGRFNKPWLFTLRQSADAFRSILFEWS